MDLKKVSPAKNSKGQIWSNKSGEYWREIKSLNGFYLVSTYGRVKSKNGVFAYQFKPKTSKYRYVRIKLPNEKERVSSVHRLVAEAFIPNPGNKEEVNHIDGYPSNNHYKNLQWCTRLENIHHAIETGLLDPVGENNPNATLDNKTVLELRKMYSKGKRIITISRDFNINYNNVARVVKGQSWKHLPILNPPIYLQLSMFA